MAKFCGVIGFAVTKETRPGIYEDQIEEHSYVGDLIRNSRRLQTGSQVNDDINISNQISIVADPYANQNFHAMRYATYLGTKWKITNVEVQYPRLILELGGVWNGQ